MKVVVTGASGLLGRAVHAHFSSQGHDVLGLANSRAEHPLVRLDLLDTSALRKALVDFAPDIIVHSAAERRPDVVEREPERSQELNVDVPGRIAEICRDDFEPSLSPRLIYISTDYVFDGSKPPYSVDSEPNPLNAYGTSKLLGERAVSEKGAPGRVTSLRVPVLYGPALQPNESAVNILQTTILPRSDPSATIKMDAYAVRYPTNVQDVARVLGEIATCACTQQKQLPPILHFQATEAMTKYDMCNVMSRLQNRYAPPLSETSVSHLDPEFEIDPMAATARPRHCKLDTSVLRELGVDVGHVTFEEWWNGEMQRQAREEEERARKQAEEEEEQRRKEEEEEERQRVAAAAAAAEEQAEKERLAAEEAERQRVEKERREQAEAEAAAAAAAAAKEEQERQAKAAEVSAIEDAAQSAETGAVDAASSSGPGAQSQSQSQSPREETASPPQPQTQPQPSPPSASQGSATPAPAPAAPTPSSPNPSFSSLRARPTPPGSSARSPSNSQPASLRNAEGVLSDEQQQQQQQHPPVGPPPVPTKPSLDAAASSSSSTSPSTSTNATPQSSQTIKPNPFRTASPRRAETAALETGDASRRAMRRPAGNDDDDDDDDERYGQPSPRPGGGGGAEGEGGSATAADPPGNHSTFKDGYGEVQFGLDDGKKAQAGDRTKLSADSTPTTPAFVIRVGDPHKVGDAMTGHIVYTVRTQTRTPGFKAETFSALRRYNDFRWLHAALVHNNPGIIIPPVPEKVRGLISRFSPDLVEARRHGLEICVNKITNHPVLAKDEDLKLFLESEDFSRDVKVRDARKGPVPTPEQKTWMGWSGTVGVNSGHKFHEYDEWFDQQKAYLDALEAQLKGMVKSINALAQSRKELADSIAASSHSLLMLSGSSLSRSLSACFAGLGDLQRRAQELEDVQSDSDVRHFGSVLYEYERVVGSVRKAFSTRVDCWHLMQKADDELRRMRIKHEKLKREPAANHYYEESLKDLAEAQDRALERHAETDKVSKRCKDEMKRFDKEKVEDLREAIDKWIVGQIERREELLEEWIDYSQKCLSLDLLTDEEREQRRAKQEEADKAAQKANDATSTTTTTTNGKPQNGAKAAAVAAEDAKASGDGAADTAAKVEDSDESKQSGKDGGVATVDAQGGDSAAAAVDKEASTQGEPGAEAQGEQHASSRGEEQPKDTAADENSSPNNQPAAAAAAAGTAESADVVDDEPSRSGSHSDSVEPRAQSSVSDEGAETEAENDAKPDAAPDAAPDAGPDTRSEGETDATPVTTSDTDQAESTKNS